MFLYCLKARTMFKLIGLFFIVFILFVVFGLAVLANIIQSLFGFGKKSTDSHFGQTSRPEETTAPKTQKKKVFDDDEGEYVEFEEIKDKQEPDR